MRSDALFDEPQHNIDKIFNAQNLLDRSATVRCQDGLERRRFVLMKDA